MTLLKVKKKTNKSYIKHGWITKLLLLTEEVILAKHKSF